MRKAGLIFLSLMLFLVAQLFSQASTTNVSRLQDLSRVYRQNFQQEKQEAENWARANGVPIKIFRSDSVLIEIKKLENGQPVYYRTENENAARTVRTDWVWPGGRLGLNLTGSGITLGEWDAGGVLLSHTEFDGRVTQRDAASSTHYHATHVAGTMMAAGVVSRAKGMAWEARLDAYDWSYDESEMATAAAEGLLFSNHSYGYITGWEYDYRGDSRWAWFGTPSISETEDDDFGYYGRTAREWDEIAWNAPYYLIVKSAGNDRNDSGPSSGDSHWVYQNGGWELSTRTREPDGGSDGYDCIGGGSGVAKNILTVGAVHDITDGYDDPDDVGMSSFSGWGPTDDGRIKPDIVANGVGLFSCRDSDNYAYATLSGTSMSSPNATGSLALLQQHFQETHGGQSMLAATLKTLIIHSALEAGDHPGPDYAFGWGLLNTAGAAEIISGDPAANQIQELLLNDQATFTRNITSDGTQPLRVTIAWTDPPGTSPSPSLNNRTPMLVNDLDLRLMRNSDGQTFFPWKLDVENPANAAMNADNRSDNIEQVLLTTPAPGDYTIQVSHKGTLFDSQQKFSLIVTGISQGAAECLPPFLAVEDLQGAPGTNILVNVLLEANPEPIDAFGFVFKYNPAQFQFVSAQKTGLTSPFSFFQASENTPGEVTLGGFHTTAIPANSQGVFLQISLNVLECTPGETENFQLMSPMDDLTELNLCPGVFACGESCELGDVNRDEAITPADALCAFQNYMNSGPEPGSECDNPCSLTASDANCDGTITPEDARIIFVGYMDGLTPPLSCPSGARLAAKATLPPHDSALRGVARAWQDTVFLQIDLPVALAVQSFGLDLNFPADDLTFLTVKSANQSDWKMLQGQEKLPGLVTIGGFRTETGPAASSLCQVLFTRKNKKPDFHFSLFNLVDDLTSFKSPDAAIQMKPAAEGNSAAKGLPSEWKLLQNYPNPFNSQTEIQYRLPQTATVEISIFNTSGQKIRTLVTGEISPGNHRIRWNGRNDAGLDVPSGVYFCRIVTPGFQEQRKMVLIK